MDVLPTIERVESVTAVCALDAADRGAVTTALADVAKVESWAAARRAELIGLLKAIPGSFPEADVADSTGSSLNAATKETDRARTLEEADLFAEALDTGDIRPGHVDALSRTTRRLTAEQAERLLDDQSELVDKAATSSIRAFEDTLRRKARALESERDAEARFERQQRNTRLRHWVDPMDGMWCMSGRFDPQTGTILARQLDDAVSALFAEATPSTAPANPVEKQQHLAALALVRLVDGDAPATKRPGDPVVVVDATNAVEVAGSNGPSLDWGIPVELPLSVLRDVFDVVDPGVVVVSNGVVLHAPGHLDLGRSTRLANRAQRRALRGLYATCAIPGCATHYDRCKLHHVTWWRDGGATDLDNLLPVCAHHHSKIHDSGWKVSLGPRRELTLELPDGTIRSTGPASRRPAA